MRYSGLTSALITLCEACKNQNSQLKKDLHHLKSELQKKDQLIESFVSVATAQAKHISHLRPSSLATMKAWSPSPYCLHSQPPLKEVLHVGVNDTFCQKSDWTKLDFKLLFNALKDSGKSVFVPGQIPTLGHGAERFNQILGLHTFDNLLINNLFWDHASLFRNDGIHPNKRGSQMLSANIQHTIQSFTHAWLFTWHTPTLNTSCSSLGSPQVTVPCAKTGDNAAYSPLPALAVPLLWDHFPKQDQERYHKEEENLSLQIHQLSKPWRKKRNSKKSVKMAMFAKRQHKQNHATGKPANKRSKKVKDKDKDTSEEDDFWILCTELFGNPKPKEKCPGPRKLHPW